MGIMCMVKMAGFNKVKRNLEYIKNSKTDLENSLAPLKANLAEVADVADVLLKVGYEKLGQLDSFRIVLENAESHFKIGGRSLLKTMRKKHIKHLGELI